MADKTALEEFRQDSRATGAPLLAATKHLLRELCSLALGVFVVVLIQWFVGKYISGELSVTEQFQLQMTEALSNFQPMALFNVFMGGNIDVKKTPQYLKCVQDKKKNGGDNARKPCTSGLLCALDNPNVDETCVAAVEKMVDDAHLHGPAGPGLWIAQFFSTVNFVWGVEPSLNRLLVCLQLFLGGFCIYRFLTYFPPRRGMDWLYAVLAFAIGTVVFGTILAIPMKWVAAYSMKWFTGVYVAATGKSVLDVAGTRLVGA